MVLLDRPAHASRGHERGAWEEDLAVIKGEKRMRDVVLALALLVLGATAASAQTTESTTSVSVNIGAPARATFTFGTVPGATQLVVQCDIAAPFDVPGRAWLIFNFYVYGEQSTTDFFPVVCTSSGYPSTPTFSVAPTTVDVTRYNADGTTTPITVTVSSAAWQSKRTGCGRSGTPCYKYGTGAAMITLN
jgi:hypothetical protein